MSFRIDQLAVLNLVTVGNSVTAGSFVRSGGTAAQFLKADGSVDTNTYVTGGPYLPLSGGNVTGRVEFQYAVDRYSQAWRNNSSGAYWWVTTDSDKLGYHRNGDGDKFYFSNGGDFWSSTNGWLSTALSGKLSSDNDSEQQAGLRYLYWNEGSRRMNTDPRWNESGYDADLGCLHIWAWTAAGVAYGRAGIALYNGSAYQYLTTKASTTGMFINNTQIVTNSGTWSINVTGNSATTSQTNFSSLTVNNKHVRDSSYRTYSGSSDYYSGGSAGWYTVAQITLTTNCSGAVLYGTLYDHRYDGADTYQIAVVARADCEFTSNNEAHYINVGCTILGSTYYTDYRSKIRVILSASSSGSRTYELQFYESAWNNDTWQLETTGWTIYTTPQAPSSGTGTARVNYISNQSADYQRANTAMYSPIYYDSQDTAYYVDPNNNSKLLNLGLGNVTPDVRLSVNGDSHISGILYMGGTAGSYNSWGSRTYTSSGLWYNNSNGVEFNNYGYGSTWSFTINGGNAISSGSMRAPIFYDSNDTTYYLDPNAGTSLNIAGKITTAVSNGTIISHGSMTDAIGYNNSYGTYIGSVVGGTYYIYANGQMYNNGPIVTLLHSSNYTSWAQQKVYQGQSAGDWQNFTNDVGEFRVDEVLNINAGGHSNQPPSVYTYGGVMSWRTNNHSFQLYASHTGDITFKTQWGNDNYSGWRRILHEANYNSWAPSLTGGGASGTWGINVTGTAGSISGYNNPTTSATANTIAYRDSVGDITVRELTLNVSVQDFTPSSMVAIYPTTNQAVKVTASGARAFLNVPTRTGGDASGTWSISISGNAGSVGGYSVSSLLKLNEWNGNVYLHTDGRIYGTIFYDANNDGYYLNPNGTSSIVNLHVQGGGYASNAWSSSSGNEAVRVYAPGGASASWDGGITGAFRIKLPQRANNTMWSMTVRIYNYSTNQVSEYTMGNYSYDQGGYNASAHFIGAASAPVYNVRFGNQDGVDCVWIGETSSGWSYPVVSVIDFQGGFRGGNASTWDDGWNITYVTSFGTVATTIYPSVKFGNVNANDISAASVSASNVYASSDVRGNDVYTTGGWFRNHTNNNGIYWSSTGWHLMPADGSDFRMHSGNSGAVALRMETNGSTRGYVYANSSNEIGFLNSGRSWSFRVENGGKIVAHGPIARTSHSNGFLEGSYNNIGGNSAYTNPIYTIGSSYNPTDSSLSNMYGIGYAHPNLWGSGKTSDWGMYVCNNGTINATIGSGSTTIWAQNDIVAYSDARVKDNIEVVENAVEKIQAIRGVTFTRTDANDKDRNKRHAGVIAQEVLKVLPEVVSGTDEDMYSVAYGNMAALFIEAIKEQQKQIEDLKNEIQVLKENK